MRRVETTEWRPLLLALGGALVLLALALGTQVQAENWLFQTVPTPTPPVVPTPGQGVTPRPPGENPSAGGTLTLNKEVVPQDVLPGEELEYRLWITNTSTNAITGIVLADPLDPALDLLEVGATQGAAEVIDRSLIVHVDTLEVGETAFIIIRARVNLEALPGQIILNQATASYGGGQASSNVVAAGLPPDELPATGQDRREP